MKTPAELKAWRNGLGKTFQLLPTIHTIVYTCHGDKENNMSITGVIEAIIDAVMMFSTCLIGRQGCSRWYPEHRSTESSPTEVPDNKEAMEQHSCRTKHV